MTDFRTSDLRDLAHALAVEGVWSDCDVAMCRWAADEIDRLRRQVQALKAKDEAEFGNYWAWQGDGEDYPDSLTCPVVMSANQLRELLARRSSHERH